MCNNKIKALSFGIITVILFSITTGCYLENEKNIRIPDKEINMILFCSDNHVAAGIFQFTCHP